MNSLDSFDSNCDFDFDFDFDFVVVIESWSGSEFQCDSILAVKLPVYERSKRKQKRWLRR